MDKHWRQYEPTEQQPWNLPRVWMLHRRAGFGVSWQRLQRDLNDGPSESVTRILNAPTDEQTDEFEVTARHLLRNALQSGQISRLSAWWILRMYLGPDAFTERRTLMWHNHFATSNQTIQNPFRMFRQNRIFREHGNGKFATLLEQTVKDPAMLVWLNANENRQGHPNENLGRELLELFSLGVGNYTETDVKEAARALAGWTVNERMQPPMDPFSDSIEDVMRIRTNAKDTFDKTILGQSGNWDGDDLLKIVLNHPATSKRLAWRICDELFGEDVVSEAALSELATGIKQHELDLQWAFETVLKSQLFFSAANLKSKIAAPETFVLGCLIALETNSRPASTLALSNIFTALGRSLFQPPNVGGWDGGRVWLNARTLVARSNFVHNVILNGLNRHAQPPNVDEIVQAFDDNKDVESVVTQLAELLLGLDRTSATDRKLIEATIDEVRNRNSSNKWSFAAQFLLNTSSAHLC